MAESTNDGSSGDTAKKDNSKPQNGNGADEDDDNTVWVQLYLGTYPVGEPSEFPRVKNISALKKKVKAEYAELMYVSPACLEAWNGGVQLEARAKLPETNSFEYPLRIQAYPPKHNVMATQQWPQLGMQAYAFAQGASGEEEAATTVETPLPQQEVEPNNPTATPKPLRTNDTWETMFQRLVEFKAQYGHVQPSNARGTVDAKLGSWVHYQRRKHRQGTLPEGQRLKLVEIGCEGLDGVGQTVPRRNETWEAMYQRLHDFKDQHGHVQPSNVPGSVDQKLGSWVHYQRRKHRQGTLPEDHRQKLVDIGCHGFDEEDGGSNSEPNEPVAWETWYQRLEEFKDHSGHANPTKSDGEQKLAQWIMDQRKRYHRGTLPEDQVRQLVELGCNGFDDEGYEYETPTRRASKMSWDERFQELEEYRDRFGNANPTKNNKATKDDYALAQWLTDQRKRFRKGGLQQDQIERLQNLGSTGFD